jgi:hypothetical protein
MELEYKAWLGRPVILKIAQDDVEVPLRGKLLRESGETIRIRIGEGWDIEIYKTMILAVEEDGMALGTG